MAVPAPTSNEGIATTRTGWFTLVTLYLITIINEFLPDDLDLGTWIAPIVVTAILTFFYRLSLYLADNYRWWGVVLFLLNRAPGYRPPPPVDPVAEEVPPPDGGAITLQTVMQVVVIVAAIVFIVWLVDINIG